jgi:subtilisin family serine protease
MRTEWKGLAVLGAVLLAACSDTPTGTTTPLAPEATLAQADQNQVGPNDYIVMLRDDVADVSAVSARLSGLAGARVKTTWGAAIKGFLAEVPPGAVARLSADPAVISVARDQMAYPDVVQPVAGIWGLDRIQERTLPLDGVYTYNSTGAGIHVYIIDTGINLAHTQFTGRIGNGISFVPGKRSVSDCNGHGTHVAGTIGGTTFGVAKRVILHPVRVFDCTGGAPFSRIISAVNWVMLNDVAPAVTNMSLGGGFDAATNAAVNNLVLSGNVVAVAAGNSNVNACGTSPASAANAITVGSTGEGATIPPAQPDWRSSFSNWGPCLDIFAPGRNIRSAWWTSPVATAVLSGTSMASPHVAGVAARRRQVSPLFTAFQIRNDIVANATLGVVINAGLGSPNRLLYSSYFP